MREKIVDFVRPKNNNFPDSKKSFLMVFGNHL